MTHFEPTYPKIRIIARILKGGFILNRPAKSGIIPISFS